MGMQNGGFRRAWGNGERGKSGKFEALGFYAVTVSSCNHFVTGSFPVIPVSMHCILSGSHEVLYAAKQPSLVRKLGSTEKSRRRRMCLRLSYPVVRVRADGMRERRGDNSNTYSAVCGGTCVELRARTS